MMLLWIAALLLGGEPNQSSATKDADCVKTLRQIRRIESRMRAGYTARQGRKLEDRLRELRKRRARVCR